MNIRTGSILYNGKKNVIWGCGNNGIELLFRLLSYGIRIESFCDVDKDKQGIRIFNKEVTAPEYILNNIQEYNVIISMAKREYQDESIRLLEEIGYQDYILYEDIPLNLFSIDTSRIFLYRVIFDSYDKKIIVYGNGAKTRKIIQILNLLDVKIEYIIDDVENEYEWEGYWAKPIYKLLSEKSRYKVVVSSEEMDIRKLDELGLVFRVDYNYISEYRRELPRKNILDPNLGYSFYLGQNSLPGIVQFGGDEAEKVIVVLGGSTSDAALYPFKSWSEILYKKLMDAGIKVKILCAACTGYKTSQELIKLVRDIIPMHPDMVISLSGDNDAALNRNYDGNEKYPFVHHYQMELFDKISRSIASKSKYMYLALDNDVIYGVENCLSRSEQFINNVTCMYNVCKGFGIKYHCFLQPMILTKNKHSLKERELIANTNQSKEYMDYIRSFLLM